MDKKGMKRIENSSGGGLGMNSRLSPRARSFAAGVLGQDRYKGKPD